MLWIQCLKYESAAAAFAWPLSLYEAETVFSPAWEKTQPQVEIDEELGTGHLLHCKWETNCGHSVSLDDSSEDDWG